MSLKTRLYRLTNPETQNMQDRLFYGSMLAFTLTSLATFGMFVYGIATNNPWFTLPLVLLALGTLVVVSVRLLWDLVRSLIRTFR